MIDGILAVAKLGLAGSLVLGSLGKHETSPGAVMLEPPAPVVHYSVHAASKIATIKVGGMTCGGCAIGVRTALSRVGGVAKAEVSYEDQRAVITYDPSKVSTDKLLATVRSFGYKAALLEVKDQA